MFVPKRMVVSTLGTMTSAIFDFTGPPVCSLGFISSTTSDAGIMFTSFAG